MKTLFREFCRVVLVSAALLCALAPAYAADEDLWRMEERLREMDKQAREQEQRLQRFMDATLRKYQFSTLNAIPRIQVKPLSVPRVRDLLRDIGTPLNLTSRMEFPPMPRVQDLTRDVGVSSNLVPRLEPFAASRARDTLMHRYWEEQFRSQDLVQQQMVSDIMRQVADPYQIWLGRKMESDLLRMGSLYFSTASFAAFPSGFGGVALGVKAVRELSPQPAHPMLRQGSRALGGAGIARHAVRDNWIGVGLGTLSMVFGEWGHAILSDLRKPIIVSQTVPIDVQWADPLTGSLTRTTGVVTATRGFHYDPYSLRNWPRFGAPDPCEGTENWTISYKFTTTTHSGGLTTPSMVLSPETSRMLSNWAAREKLALAQFNRLLGSKPVWDQLRYPPPMTTYQLPSYRYTPPLIRTRRW